MMMGLGAQFELDGLGNDIDSWICFNLHGKLERSIIIHNHTNVHLQYTKVQLKQKLTLQHQVEEEATSSQWGS